MTALTKFQCFGLDVGLKKHNLLSDTLLVMLTNVAPDAAANAVIGDITEITPGNGYSAGGLTIAVTSFTQTGGVAKLVLADSQLLTATGTVGPFRYCVLYNNTAAAKNLIGYGDYGSALTLATGQEFQVQPNATSGVLTIT